MAHGYAESVKTYSKVLAALLTLTVITVLAAGINFGTPSVNIVVALTIASLKGALVALFFMHLKDESPVNAIIFVTALVMLAIFLIFSLIDVGSRVQVRPANLAQPAGAAVMTPAQPETSGEPAAEH